MFSENSFTVILSLMYISIFLTRFAEVVAALCILGAILTCGVAGLACWNAGLLCWNHALPAGQVNLPAGQDLNGLCCWSPLCGCLPDG